MSANDQLERDVEAALARLVTDAVPDTRRVPAPPWREQQRRSRTSDVRRFGRATPWLIAAVLLVIAGLGIGAGVVFDAGAPDRGPVGTRPPSPGVTTTAPDGTLGTPTSSPSAHPTLSRNSNSTGPDDGVSTGPTSIGGNYIAGIGYFGPVRVGMNEVEAMLATGVHEGAFGEGPGPCRSREVPKDGVPYTGMAEMYDVDGLVVGIQAAGPATDRFGNGVGTTLARLRESYPGGQLGQTGRGWTFAVLDAAGNGLGFNLSVAGVSPADNDTVAYLFAGTADYARGQELCSG